MEEIYGRVVGGPEIAAADAGVSVHPLEGDGQHAADEAADVDRTQAFAVHGPEHVPSPYDLLGHDRDVEFADLLVHAEPERDRAVGICGLLDHLDRRHECCHAGLVVGPQERRAVRGHDALTLESDEVRGRNDHALLREREVTAGVGVDDGLRAAGEFGVGVEMGGEDRVGCPLAPGARREVNQERAILELHDLAVLDARVPELAPEHDAEHQLSIGAGPLGYLGHLALRAQYRLGVDLHVPDEPIEHCFFVIHDLSSPRLGKNRTPVTMAGVYM